MSGIRGTLARWLVVALLATGLGLAAAPAAFAHNVMISSDPADGSTLAKAPAGLVFTFDQPVQDFDPVVSLVGPDGKQYATGTPTVNGNTVTGRVGIGPTGTYTAAYRVVSADGHPVTGQVHFTMTVGGGAKGIVAAGGAAGSSAGGGLSLWLWIGLAVAAIILAAAAVVLLRRPRVASADETDY